MRSFLIAIVLALALPGRGATAQETRFESSLDIVPHDVAIYMATMNHQALWMQFTESAALKSLQSSPINKKMRSAYRKRSRGFEDLGENPFRYYLEAYANSIDSVAGKAVMPYLQKIFKRELFLYADQELARAEQAMLKINRELSDLLVDLELMEDSEETIEEIQTILSENLRDLKCPTLMVGALVDEPADFASLIDVADSLIQQGFAQMTDAEELRKFYRSESLPDQRYIAFMIRGKELPWELYEEGVVNDDGTIVVLEMLKELLFDKEFAVCLAVRKNLLCFSVGPNLDHVSKAGEGARLIDHPHLQPIRDARAAGRMLHQVHFVDKSLYETNLESVKESLASLPTLMLTVLEETSLDLISDDELEQLAETMSRDAEELYNDFRKYYGNAGNSVGYIAAHEQGLEGYYYYHAANPVLDSSQPLQLIENVGAKPVFFMLARENSQRLGYHFLRKWTGKVLDYAEQLAPYLIEDEQQVDRWLDALNALRPIVRKFDEVTVNKAAPNILGSEAGIVLGASLPAASWHAEMPAAETPLPLGLPMVIAKVREEAVVKEVVVDYHTLAQEALAEFFKQVEMPETITPWEIPSLQRSSRDEFESFVVPLPANLGFAPSLSPHASIGRGLLLLGIQPEADLQRAATAPEILFGPAAESQPSMAVLYFDNRAAMELVDAWNDYWFDQWRENQGEIQIPSNGASQDLTMNEEDIRETTRRLREFLRCFQGVSMRIHEENRVQINHFLLRFSDLPTDQ